jgi:hypothetical protein
MNGRIQITVQKSQMPDGAPIDNNQTAMQEQGKPNLTQKAVNVALLNAGRQILSEGLQQYGNLSGNYAVTKYIDSALTIGADALIIIKGGAVGAIAVGTKYATQAFNRSVEVLKSNQETQLARSRVGYIAITGSRAGGR